jgi:hypothetical protein
MTDVLNTFEGGTNGTTITTGNSGGGSGTAFNFIQTVSGGASVYTSTSPYRGTLSGSFSSGGTTAGTAYAEYSTAVASSSSAPVYGRFRFMMPSLPADATGVRVGVVTDSTGAFVAEIRVTNSGAVSIRGSAGTALATFSATYAAGTFWDVDLAVLVFSSTVGQIEGRRHAADGSVAQTLTSAATLNTLGAGGTNKFQHGMIRSIISTTVVIDDVAWSLTGYPSTAVAPTVAYGPWSGGVTSSGFTATHVVGGVTSGRLVVSTSSALTSPVYSTAAAPDTDGVTKLAITGLSAGTQYYYGFEADGVLLAGGRGECKTFPSGVANFSVAFGSCQFNIPSDSTFAAILARSGPTGRALQLIHMGDMNYQDWASGTTTAQVYSQHLTSLGSASMAPMLAKIPMSYLWDNHDWGGDTSDSTAAAGNVVAATYRKVFPSYPLAATDGRGGYQSWVIGRVRFIQLDVRSYRDPQANTENSSKTMIGTEQKAWFKARLVDPEPVKVICGNYPWRDDGDGSGRWGSYSDEFTELSDYIDANAHGQVYAIFGDRHFLAADNGTSSGTRGIPQAGGAPFQQSSVAVPDTWSAGSYTISPSTLQAYGVLDISDDGDLITLAYSGITSLDGTTRVSMSTVFDTLINGTASVTGGGSVAATVVQRAPATVAGAGAVSAAVVQRSTATVAGAGTVTAGAGGVVTGTATVVGVGTVAAATVQRAGSAVIGAGVVSATSATGTAGGSATVTGAGVVSATANVVLRGTATVAGTGTVAATGSIPGSKITVRPYTGITVRP